MDPNKNLDPTDTFDENPGIHQRFVPKYTPTDSESLPPPEPGGPVRKLRYDKPPPKLKKKPVDKGSGPIEPSISARLGLDTSVPGEVGAKLKITDPKCEKDTKRLNRLAWFYDKVEFCQDTSDLLRLPSPVVVDTLSKLEDESPQVSKAKVLPERPSALTSMDIIPPTKSKLKSRQLQSGIFLNPITSETSTEISEDEEEVYKKKKKKKTRIVKRKRPKRTKRKPQPEEEGTETGQGDADLQTFLDNLEFYEDEDEGFLPRVWHVPMVDACTSVSDNLILGPFTDQMSNASSATSVPEKDPYDDLSWCEIPLTSKLVQTLRDAQCERPKKKYRKGCLENHSFTKIKQGVLSDFAHCSIVGTISQIDSCFPKISRGNQGICMPIAAFCYAQLHRCKDWNNRSIDHIVHLGNAHFMESIAELHLHQGRKQLTVNEVNNFFFICDKKVKFEISDPEVKGLARSQDRKIFNMTTGLTIFFCDYTTGILRTEDLNVLLWKLKRGCFLFFDAAPRKSNLFQDKYGTAMMTIVPNLRALASILLDRSNIGNSPFNISQIKLLKVMDKDEREEDEYVKDRNTYIAMNDRQAVVQASFDLGDLCFLFNRNKQSLGMSLIAMAYSRISAPHSWHKKTMDKILIIGNQLYSLVAEAEKCPEVGVEHLPAVFTVGPYVIEIHIYPNRYADLMYKKSACMFSEHLKTFFEGNNNCIAQIGKSYLAIWQQRDMFFCFDPFTRNKEGLKCRKGAACCTMNKDLDTLVETVLLNFDSRDTIFHLHAIKLMRIHRDVNLTKFFPKYLALQDMPMEIFHRHKCMKSKKRATDKPFTTADFREHALKKILTGVSGGESMYDIHSTVESIGTYMMPPFDDPKLEQAAAKKRNIEDDLIVDLDSPSLSDTQIVPKRPSPYDEEINIDDIPSFGLTKEEEELEEMPEQEGGEGRGEGGEGSGPPVMMYGAIAEGGSYGGGEEESEHIGVRSQVASDELDPCWRQDFINTDLTYCYKLLPAMELPIRTKEDRDIIIDPNQADNELKKERYYEKITEEIQILTGKANAFDFIYENEDPNLIIPYMCIMAAAFDIEKPIYKWDDMTIGFVLNGGRLLYDQYTESFVHIDDFKFELEKATIMSTIHIIFHTYIGDDLFETFSGQKILEEFISRHVFNQQDVGFVIVPHYACVVFFKKSLFYLFDPYNCDKYGNVLPVGQKGRACLMRFRTMDDLVKRLITNLSKRVEENDTSGMQFRMLILAKPRFSLANQPRMHIDDLKFDVMEIQRSISEEFKRPSNYIKLPDGSQLIRGTNHIGGLGVEVEYIAPYVCIIAAIVGQKYAIRTWSADVLDFIMQAGDALYKKSHYGFIQLMKLDIPHIALGHEDFSCEVRYIFDSPCEMQIIKAALEKVLCRENEWVFIVTEVFTGAVCKRNGIYYLYNPFPTNELGLDEMNGFSSVARFRNLENLCFRIMFNKTKRDRPEKGTYIRFALYVCKVSKRPKSHVKMKYPGDDMGEMYPEEGQEEEEEKETPARTQHGYKKVTNVEVIEGTRYLPRPEADQEELGEDHFAAIAASLMVIHKPLEDWSSKNIDKSMDIGKQIYDHADSLECSKRRTIKNILVGKYFFDVIVKAVEVEPFKYRRTFRKALNYIMRKRKFLIIQTGEGTYALYADIDNASVHLYHPYTVTFKDKGDSEDISNACWIKFKNFKQVIKFLKESNDLRKFKFYSFNVINVAKAPRSVIVSVMIQDWIRAKQVKGEIAGKSFNEHESWMDLHDNPWAKLGIQPVKGTHNKWFAWDIEYCNDLYILCGTINEYDRRFKMEWRGKQTFCTLVAVIGMTGIYDLKEWNQTVIDAVLISGYKYFVKCVEGIDDENHEFTMDDLLDECEIFPFQFKVRYQPVIEGTMFLTSVKRYNLYKSLRFFFDEYYYRAGIIIVDKDGKKKMVAFAKRKENEYYLFDCMTFGKPMFAPHEGVAYMLRCTTLARLIHVLVLTLRGGEFFIYEVIADNYSAVQGDTNPYVDEKPILKP